MGLDRPDFMGKEILVHDGFGDFLGGNVNI